jgi:hypothetical protein
VVQAAPVSPPIALTSAQIVARSIAAMKAAKVAK